MGPPGGADAPPGTANHALPAPRDGTAADDQSGGPGATVAGPVTACGARPGVAAPAQHCVRRYSTATAATSIIIPGTARPVTPTTVPAGGSPVTYSRRTCASCRAVLTSVRYVVVETTASSDAPAAASTAVRFSYVCRTCA